MNRPAILLAVESLAPGYGGICRVARMMARSLAHEAAAGSLRVEAIVLTDKQIDPELKLPIRVCGGSRWRFFLRVRRALLNSSHVIYDFAGIGRAHQFIWPSTTRAACWIHGIEVWEHIREDYLQVLRRSDRLFSNSHYTLQRAQSRNQELAQAQVCWLATEADEDPEDLGVAKSNTVLIVGRIDAGDRPEWPRYKGHDALIHCWPEIVRRVPDARLVIIGDGPGRPQVEAVARKSSASAAIEMRGFVSEAELALCYATARIFAMPSRGEGFGLVYVEAMRHRLPLIASCHDAAPEINLDGETGFNVDLDQPGQLTERLLCLLENPGKARQMGEAGYRRWRDHFRFRAFQTRFLEMGRPWWGGPKPAGVQAATKVQHGAH